MATLRSSDRDRLPDRAFAYVDTKGRRRLPINDAAHVRNALARFNQVVFEDEAGAEVVGHSDVAPGRKTDPGPAFDELEPVRRRVVTKIKRQCDEKPDERADQRDDARDRRMAIRSGRQYAQRGEDRNPDGKTQ